MVVLEKGSEVGAHILSGAVIDPIGLNALIPDWKAKGAPVETAVSEDRFYYLGPAGVLRIPNFIMPPLMSNHGNYIVSLGNLCRWLGEQAAEMGVEVYPGFAAAEILYDEAGAVAGVATGDMGVGKDGQPTDRFTRGMELKGKYTIIAEGARGSLSKVADGPLRPGERDASRRSTASASRSCGRCGPRCTSQAWSSIRSAGRSNDRTGEARSSITTAPTWCRSASSCISTIANPYLSPYGEFQRFKTHPAIRDTFEGGKRIAYGARALTEGGWQSIPKLAFPGGVLVGCAAGFMNVPRIKGSHNAMLSGIAAAEAAFAAIGEGRAHDRLEAYAGRCHGRPHRPRPAARAQCQADAGQVRHGARHDAVGCRHVAQYGAARRRASATRSSTASRTMRRSTRPAPTRPIAYPKPDGVLTFDRLTNVSFSGTNHEEDQPVHLKVADPRCRRPPSTMSTPGRRTATAPAGVYEWLEEPGGPRYVINAQNCVHCKTCDIKDPNQNINWVVPEGGGGPNYPRHVKSPRQLRPGGAQQRPEIGDGSAEVASRRAEGVRPDRRLGAAAVRDAVAARCARRLRRVARRPAARSRCRCGGGCAAKPRGQAARSGCGSTVGRARRREPRSRRWSTSMAVAG